MAAITDKFNKAFNTTNPNVALVTATRSAAATTLVCDDLTGWPTATAVHFSTYQVDTNGDVVAGTQIDWKGVVSGNTVTGLVRKAGVTDTGSVIGDVVEMNPTGSWVNDLMDGVLAQHNQDGTHAAVTATSLNVSGAVTLPSASINQTALPLGAVVQLVNSETGAVATGSTLIPPDDTIPQNTEGDQYLSVSITPKSTTNLLVIDVVVFGSPSVANDVIVALFQDSTASAIAVTSIGVSTGGVRTTIPLKKKMTAGTTSATTFKVRVGMQLAGTFTLNGFAGGRFYGGAAVSSITITEIKA